MEFLFVEVTPIRGRECRVRPGETVGREGCDHALADPDVSRRHAAFREAGAGLAVEDLGSTNGTFLNESRVTEPGVLAPGDRLRFGNTVWVLE